MKIDICMVSDENLFEFIPTVWTTITTTNPEHSFVFHLVHNVSDTEILEKLRTRMASLFPSVQANYYFAEWSASYSTTLQHVTAATMLRLFIPSLLANVSRVLYLDIDIVVMGDLTELWAMAIGPRGINIKTSIYPGYTTFNGHRAGNAGVMLMDLDELRKREFTRICLANHVNYGGHDQELINRYLEGDYNELADHMNVFVRQDDTTIKHPFTILHYAGGQKPMFNNFKGAPLLNSVWHSAHKLTRVTRSKIPPGYTIGVLTYTTTNMGDWYQTAAALYVWWNYLGRLTTFRSFLDSCITTSTAYGVPICWLDRDTMSSAVKPDTCSKVVLLCNAWWMYKNPALDKYDLPLPNWIIPIYTSVHLKDKGIIEDLAVVRHFKQYKPIGCRDMSTVSLLKSKGVDAYFSACLTTTLNLNDPQLGFTVTHTYAEPIDIDCRKSALTNNIPKGTATIARIPEIVQAMINYRTAPCVTTMRLHIWLPLVSNGGNAVLWNTKKNRPYIPGDPDIQGQSQNRFTGLFELGNGSQNTLLVKKQELFYDTMYRIATALNGR